MSTTIGNTFIPTFSISSAAVKMVPSNFGLYSAVLAATTILNPFLASFNAIA